MQNVFLYYTHLKINNMHVRLLLTILLTGFGTQAQPGVDSLKYELSKIERLPSSFNNDTLHFRLLTDLAKKTTNWEQARSYWQKAIGLADNLGWDQGRLEGYKGMGIHYRMKGSLTDAADYFHRGLALSEQIKDYRYQSDCYQALALAYSSAGDFEKSLENHKMALKLIDTTDRKRLLNCLNEIGNTYFDAHKFALALGYYQKCLRINSNPIDSMRQSWFLGNVAASYQKLNMFDSSLKAYTEFFKYGKWMSTGDSIVSYSQLGQVYLLLKKPDLGLDKALIAYRIGFPFQNYHSGQLVSQTLSEAYREKGDWKNAFLHEQQFRAYSDSIHFQEQRRKLEGIKIGYESEKKRAGLESQMEISLIVMSFLGLLALVLFVFLYLLGKRRKKIEHQRNEISIINNSLENRVQERTAELQLANTELIRKNREIEEALLKGQTLERKRVASELHNNLGGTLSAIQWYMEALQLSDAALNLKHEGYDNLYRMVSRAYAEVRLLAHHMMPDALEKQGLEEALQELASQINKANRLSLTVDTKEVSLYLDSQQKFELYSIALELCTNIMKHAYATEARLSLDRTEHEIVLCVSDNGIGMPENQQKKSMGLKNIQDRLETIGGYCILHSEKDKGTTVLIRIPYQHVQQEVLEIGDHKQVNS